MNISYQISNWADNFNFRRLSDSIAVIALSGRIVDVGLAACIVLKADGKQNFMRLAGCNVTQFQSECLAW